MTAQATKKLQSTLHPRPYRTAPPFRPPRLFWWALPPLRSPQHQRLDDTGSCCDGGGLLHQMLRKSKRGTMELDPLPLVHLGIGGSCTVGWTFYFEPTVCKGRVSHQDGQALANVIHHVCKLSLYEGCACFTRTHEASTVVMSRHHQIRKALQSKCVRSLKQAPRTCVRVLLLGRFYPSFKPIKARDFINKTTCYCSESTLGWDQRCKPGTSVLYIHSPHFEVTSQNNECDTFFYACDPVLFQQILFPFEWRQHLTSITIPFCVCALITTMKVLISF